jgi:Domain of unknown function (DUF4158)
VAVKFLTDEQAAGYGRFEGEPSQAELERFFFLDDADRDQVARRRGPHSQLGFAVQLGTVWFLGTFLSPDPLDVPWNVWTIAAPTGPELRPLRDPASPDNDQ